MAIFYSHKYQNSDSKVPPISCIYKASFHRSSLDLQISTYTFWPIPKHSISSHLANQPPDLSKSHLSTCASTMYDLHVNSFDFLTKKSRNPLIYQGLREVRPTGFEPATFRIGVDQENTCAHSERRGEENDSVISFVFAI